jgi:hypothetical protein
VRQLVIHIGSGSAAMHRMESLAITSPWANSAEQPPTVLEKNGALQLESQISAADDEVASDISCHYMILHLT